MSSLSWYWHRLRAMTPAELTGHARRKIHQFSDGVSGARRFAAVRDVSSGGQFPQLPSSSQAPKVVKEALRHDARDILAGRWIAFGQIELAVDDPPRWHKDYLTGTDLATREKAVKLNHRLQGNADIKLLWEPNRWFSLVRLAQAAHVLGDPQAAAACCRWLNNWVDENQPFLGWNWTSALETGMRLIQFAWIDSLLNSGATRSLVEKCGSSAETGSRSWPELRAAVLLPHLWFTWRDRSFGSSANNHLLGELAGLIVALVRWPDLCRWAAPLDELQRQFEREVLIQFFPDGGNAEQALGYHWYSWEFCWQATLALRAMGRPIDPKVEERLRAGATFFQTFQVSRDHWEYGDSDGAFVTPFFADWRAATAEWHGWLHGSSAGDSIRYWIGDAPKPLISKDVVGSENGWRVYPQSGMAVCQVSDWFLRWDFSPLGFLATASHGHCDALHLSAWFKGEPILIDPGTGAYYADKDLRNYLASWAAHNGPHPPRPGVPVRMGAFLWSPHHETPRWTVLSARSMRAELKLPGGKVSRTISYQAGENGWKIEDCYAPVNVTEKANVEVLWQLAPKARISESQGRVFQIKHGPAAVELRASAGWTTVEKGEPGSAKNGEVTRPGPGTCSPGFRLRDAGPYVLARGEGHGSVVLETSLSALPNGAS